MGKTCCQPKPVCKPKKEKCCQPKPACKPKKEKCCYYVVEKKKCCPPHPYPGPWPFPPVPPTPGFRVINLTQGQATTLIQNAIPGTTIYNINQDNVMTPLTFQVNLPAGLPNGSLITFILNVTSTLSTTYSIQSTGFIVGPDAVSGPLVNGVPIVRNYQYYLPTNTWYQV